MAAFSSDGRLSFTWLSSLPQNGQRIAHSFSFGARLLELGHWNLLATTRQKAFSSCERFLDKEEVLRGGVPPILSLRTNLRVDTTKAPRTRSAF
jgi:hypothetical protein